AGDVKGRTTVELGVIDPPRRAAVLRQLGESGTAGDIALTVRRTDDSLRDVVLSLVRIELGGESCTLGIFRDVTEGKRADEQLRVSRAALRSLATRQQNVREDERARIAREIHDSLGQALTALKLDLAAAREVARRSDPALAERLAETARTADDLVKGVRRIATELRPPILDELGLPAAIEWLARDFSRRTGIACRAAVQAGEGPLRADLATALFRILQESLTNVSRHAGAAAVDVELTVSSDVVTLEIRDDGCGITMTAATGPRSLGILGMRERAAALGGVLEVVPHPGGGTKVAAWFPPGRRARSRGKGGGGSR
ncbi:MAG: sensor histidine kinase, partial [Gemmatimonadales bacterium]